MISIILESEITNYFVVVVVVLINFITVAPERSSVATKMGCFCLMIIIPLSVVSWI